MNIDKVNIVSVSEYERYDRLVNLPDLEFTSLCRRKYSINRGVFNVIDDWFFNYGMTNIAARRKTILQFLAYVYEKKKPKQSEMYLQFGKGGIKNHLYYFTDKCLNQNQTHE
ncbi:RNA-binding riboflavin kinase [Bacillus freudenreichii]|nr:RNA-binding riboflavin kinase [Bacillus freudenreichii]